MSYHANGGGPSEGGIPDKTFMPSYQAGRLGRTTLIYQTTKSVSYKEGNSDQVYAVGDTTSATSSSGEMPNAVNVKNSGVVPITVMIGYKTYSDEDTIVADGGESKTRYIHYMLMPGETYSPPVRGVIMTAYDANVTQFDGTTVDNIASSSVNSGLLWKDITADLGADVNATTDPITITTAANHTNFFRVGDLIQIGRGTTQADLTESNHYREILRVQSITSTTEMVCERALHGTDAGDSDSANWNQGHANTFPIFLPFFNAYHDVDKYSVAQTDATGRFKCNNFFGVGRSTTDPNGIVPGSVSLKFYEAGYQEFGISGLSASSNTGLETSTEYKFNITVDGGSTFSNLTFETDSANTNFGGSNGLTNKIQSALDAQYYTAGNLFEKRISVGVVGGDFRITSGQRLSTSAILIEAPDSGTTPFGVGRLPAIGNIDKAVPARLPDDVNYSNITYSTTPNNVFMHDDGFGNLIGPMGGGSINYSTGAINMVNCPVNAEFVYSVAHTSAFSGGLTTSSTTKGGALTNILVNTVCQKRNGNVTVSVF